MHIVSLLFIHFLLQVTQASMCQDSHMFSRCLSLKDAGEESSAPSESPSQAPSESPSEASSEAPSTQPSTADPIDFTVFATSVTFAADQGIEAADTLCQERADLAESATSFGIYKAFLSTTTQDARDRIRPLLPNVRYVRTDDEVVADSFDDLLDGTLLTPIDHNEFGNSVGGLAWTGSNPDGTLFTNGGQETPIRNCQDWTSTAGDGVHGELSEINEDWSTREVSQCSRTRRLYCFQVFRPPEDL